MTIRHKNLKILLVSDNKADIGNIKIRLEESIDFPCYVWHCLTLSEALDYLNKRKLRVDIVILDLGLIGTADPKEVYERMGCAAQSTPIIAITGADQEGHDLATFVMEAGASDHMVRGQFGRIVDAVEFSVIRHKIAKMASNKGSHDLENQQNAHDIEMIEEKKRCDKKNREKNEYISWVMGSYSVEQNHKKV